LLSDLLGSKSAERILLFLFVNEYCYANEIHRMQGTAISPLQNALHRLEKAGILIFEIQGKTKLYRFNLNYPLLEELKALLKKAFIHLPCEEKRKLFSRKAEWKIPLKHQLSQRKKTALCLHSFWQRLTQIKNVSIQTQSYGHAFGDVCVSQENHNTIVFTEKGHWKHATPQELEFSNVLRWTLDSSTGMIALEHLRYGPTRPVFLFHLSPTGPNTLQSIDSHLCNHDCYFGRIELKDPHIQFLWRIVGPRKNETLRHIYTS